MTGITLYKAADELAQALSQIDPETGEVPPEYGQMRQIVERKASLVAAYIAQREFECDAMEARIKEVSAHVKATRKRAEWLRHYLLENMKRADVTEINSDDALLHVKRLVDRDEFVDVFDESQVPNEYMRQPPTPKREPDKPSIRAAIKENKDVPGARMVKRDRLVIG